MAKDSNSSANPSRPCVLLVDDDPMALRAMERGLADLDVEIATYDRAFGLLNRIVDTRPAVVILDVRMPGLDGDSLAGLVREDELIGATRIVLHSAIDETTLSRRARQCGADAYLVKGAGMPGLVEAVSRWLPAPTAAEP